MVCVPVCVVDEGKVGVKKKDYHERFQNCNVSGNSQHFCFCEPLFPCEIFVDFASMSRANYFLKRVVQDVRHKT